MPSFRTSLDSLVIVVVAVLAASLGALVADRLGAAPPVVPAVAALVVTAVFAWRIPEGLLSFGIFGLLAATIEHWLGLDLLLFDEIALIFLVLAALATRKLELWRLRFGWLEGAILVLAGAGVLSSLVHAVPVVTWVSGLLLLLKGVVFFYLVRWLPLDTGGVARMGTILVVAGVTVGMLGFVEWLDPVAFQTALGLPLYQQERADLTVIRSVFLHPALFGWLTAFTSLILYARLVTHRTWWLLPVALLLNVGTLLSGRRTPLLGAGAAVGVGLAWLSTRLSTRRALLKVWLPVASALVIALVSLTPWWWRMVAETVHEYAPSGAAVAEVFAERPRSEVVASLHPRIALYVGSAAIARDNLPLGAGLGRFGSHLSRDSYSPLYERYGLDRVWLLRPEDPQAATDAYWSMVLGETGVVGLVAAVTFYAVLLVALWRGASHADAGSTKRTILVVGLLSTTEAVVRSFTSSVFVAPPIAYFIFGAAGLALAQSPTLPGRQLDDAGVGDAIGSDDLLKRARR